MMTADMGVTVEELESREKVAMPRQGLADAEDAGNAEDQQERCEAVG
jgi:hypothetical protein